MGDAIINKCKRSWRLPVLVSRFGQELKHTAAGNAPLFASASALLTHKILANFHTRLRNEKCYFSLYFSYFTPFYCLTSLHYKVKIFFMRYAAVVGN